MGEFVDVCFVGTDVRRGGRGHPWKGIDLF